jgi:hypothetical protein
VKTPRRSPGTSAVLMLESLVIPSPAQSPDVSLHLRSLFCFTLSHPTLNSFLTVAAIFMRGISAHNQDPLAPVVQADQTEVERRPISATSQRDKATTRRAYHAQAQSLPATQRSTCRICLFLLSRLSTCRMRSSRPCYQIWGDPSLLCRAFWASHHGPFPGMMTGPGSMAGREAGSGFLRGKQRPQPADSTAVPMSIAPCRHSI